MNTTVNDMIKELETINDLGNELNSVKAELREKDFNLKVKKSAMEFSENYADFREGLKVKEIAPKILEATIDDAEEICRLKEKKDALEHELYVAKLRFQILKEIIDDNKL